MKRSGDDDSSPADAAERATLITEAHAGRPIGRRQIVRAADRATATIEVRLRSQVKGGSPVVATSRCKWFALALLSVVQFMVVLDIAIVNVALPSIQVDLGFSQENLQWVISAYALVFGGFLLLGGRAADMLGRRRMFMSGLVVFAVGSMLAGLAWSEASLIAPLDPGPRCRDHLPAALSILMTTFSRRP